MVKPKIAKAHCYLIVRRKELIRIISFDRPGLVLEDAFTYKSTEISALPQKQETPLLSSECQHLSLPKVCIRHGFILLGPVAWEADYLRVDSKVLHDRCHGGFRSVPPQQGGLKGTADVHPLLEGLQTELHLDDVLFLRLEALAESSRAMPSCDFAPAHQRQPHCNWLPDICPSACLCPCKRTQSSCRTWTPGCLSHYLQGFIHPRWLFGISEPSTVWVPFIPKGLKSGSPGPQKYHWSCGPVRSFLGWSATFLLLDGERNPLNNHLIGIV